MIWRQDAQYIGTPALCDTSSCMCGPTVMDVPTKIPFMELRWCGQKQTKLIQAPFLQLASVFPPPDNMCVLHFG